MPPTVTGLALNLVKALKEHLAKEPFIFASPEDADYFRKCAKKKREPLLSKPVAPIAPPRPTLKTIEIPPPAPQLQTPTVMAPPLPEPPIPSIQKRTPVTGWKALFAKIAPDLPILDEIPSDAFAKKVATRWKTKNQTAPFSILYASELPEQRALLEKIAQAIDVYFGPARLVAAEPIEKEKQWEALLSVPELKMVFICDYTLWQLTDLMRHYKEVPAQGSRTLGTVPLFLLPDMSLYLKDPLLKRSLWKAICMKLSS